MSLAPVRTASRQAVSWPTAVTEPVLRRATPDDVVELAAMKRRFERRCYADLGTPEALDVRLHRRCTAWHLLTRLAEGDLMLVAEHEGGTVGMGTGRLRWHDGAPTLHLHRPVAEISVEVRLTANLNVERAVTRSLLHVARELGVQRVTTDLLVGAFGTERQTQALGLAEIGERTWSPTFPGVLLSHWIGNLHTALERVH